MKRKTLLVVVGVIACVLIGSIAGFLVKPQREIKLKIFHAGSLIISFEELEKKFEEKHPNVDVQREASGSVEAVRKITEVGKVADVVALADYGLIQDAMMPEYANWYIKFAKDSIVLAYTDQSKYAEDINGENWYEILRKPGVRFGFSNPNLDPCGYRTPMVFKLSELHYNTSIFDLVSDNTAITLNETRGTYLINTPEHLEPRGKVTIRDKSVDLIALTKAGELDYAFEYRSVAVQHGLRFVELPPQIDLGEEGYGEVYKKVRLRDAAGKTRVGKPIVYGIAVPSNAINEKLGVEFIKLVVSEEGLETFRRLGQIPIAPAEAAGNTPTELNPGIKKCLRVATGSPYELGLMGVLSKPFEERTGCVVEVTKASTGQGLELGKKGKVDLTLGHSKEALDRYVEEGYGINRKGVMYNHFVVVGPKNDPAGIRDMTNLKEAYRRIADTNSLFLSRGDEGGMHKKEKAVWGEMGMCPSKEDWYLSSNDFMMSSLRRANELGAYHMADSSTWEVMKEELDDLELLVLDDRNVYEVTAVNPEKCPDVNYDLAKSFIDHITSHEGQIIIGDFGVVHGKPLYYPSYAPKMEAQRVCCFNFID